MNGLLTIKILKFLRLWAYQHWYFAYFAWQCHGGGGGELHDDERVDDENGEDGGASSGESDEWLAP